MSISFRNPRWLLSSLLLLAIPFLTFDFNPVFAEEEVEEPAENPVPEEGTEDPLTAAPKTELAPGQVSPSFLKARRNSSRTLLASDREAWAVWRFQDYVVFAEASLLKEKDAGDRVRAVVALMVQQKDAKSNRMLVIEKTQPELRAAWLKDSEAAQMAEKYAKLIKNAIPLN
ncbi:MAG: hypothetical protein QF437_12540 [Planctomycetota bacterium]|jgi:hypothetical protein|nr:hypothetical protein [Planctomycetota bacterium]MDP7131314.1 hypothetical protein [Planctomycetota bacterium]MDP7250522.1 hypothetical protein [Planctomycetota bacterium]